MAWPSSSTWTAASTFELDAVGLCLWKHLEHETTVAEMATHLANTYDVTPDVAATDVIEFCQELRARALVVIR